LSSAAWSPKGEPAKTRLQVHLSKIGISTSNFGGAASFGVHDLQRYRVPGHPDSQPVRLEMDRLSR
jgi:hypothetical protein